MRRTVLTPRPSPTPLTTSRRPAKTPRRWPWPGSRRRNSTSRFRRAYELPEIARAFARPCNLLVLDEPTNGLDLETLDLLPDQLAEHPGTVLLVSHDRDFLDRVVTSTGGSRKPPPPPSADPRPCSLA